MKNVIDLSSLVGGYAYLSNDELTERLFNVVRGGGGHVFGAKTLTEFLATYNNTVDLLAVVPIVGICTGVGLSGKPAQWKESQEGRFPITHAMLDKALDGDGGPLPEEVCPANLKPDLPEKVQPVSLDQLLDEVVPQLNADLKHEEEPLGASLALALTTEEKLELVDSVRRQLVETLNDLMRVRDYEHLLEALEGDKVRVVSDSGRSIPIPAGDPNLVSFLTSRKDELNSSLDKVLPSILALNKLLPEKEGTDN